MTKGIFTRSVANEIYINAAWLLYGSPDVLRFQSCSIGNFSVSEPTLDG